jgi:hypothetical protein
MQNSTSPVKHFLSREIGEPPLLSNNSRANGGSAKADPNPVRASLLRQDHIDRFFESHCISEPQMFRLPLSDALRALMISALSSGTGRGSLGDTTHATESAGRQKSLCSLPQGIESVLQTLIHSNPISSSKP